MQPKAVHGVRVRGAVATAPITLMRPSPRPVAIAGWCEVRIVSVGFRSHRAYQSHHCSGMDNSPLPRLAFRKYGLTRAAAANMSK